MLWLICSRWSNTPQPDRLVVENLDPMINTEMPKFMTFYIPFLTLLDLWHCVHCVLCSLFLYNNCVIHFNHSSGNFTTTTLKLFRVIPIMWPCSTCPKWKPSILGSRNLPCHVRPILCSKPSINILVSLFFVTWLLFSPQHATNLPWCRQTPAVS